MRELAETQVTCRLLVAALQRCTGKQGWGSADLAGDSEIMAI
jgi:hypothetical protein